MANEIDSGLDALAAIRLPGEAFTTTQIAHACKCKRRVIYDIEVRAINKLREKMRSTKLSDYIDG